MQPNLFNPEEIKKIELRTAKAVESRIFKNILEKYNLKEKKVLDIGCSYGESLSVFGPGSLGLTVNETEVNWGKLKNLNIQIGNIEEGYDTEEKFDFIFANNIFEHMLAPHLFLIKIKKYLKQDGQLILGVPCVPYIIPLINIRKFSGSLSPAHVNFFNRYTLQKTVEYGGWKVNLNSGFYFKNRILDYLFNFICPHFYIVARVNENFKYDDKRLVELSGYNQIFNLKK